MAKNSHYDQTVVNAVSCNTIGTQNKNSAGQVRRSTDMEEWLVRYGYCCWAAAVAGPFHASLLLLLGAVNSLRVSFLPSKKKHAYMVLWLPDRMHYSPSYLLSSSSPSDWRKRGDSRVRPLSKPPIRQSKTTRGNPQTFRTAVLHVKTNASNDTWYPVMFNKMHYAGKRLLCTPGMVDAYWRGDFYLYCTKTTQYHLEWSCAWHMRV